SLLPMSTTSLRLLRPLSTTVRCHSHLLRFDGPVRLSLHPFSTLDRPQAFRMTVSGSRRSAEENKQHADHIASHRMSAIDRTFGFHVRLPDGRRKHAGRGPTYPGRPGLCDPSRGDGGLRCFPAARPDPRVAQLLHRLKWDIC